MKRLVTLLLILILLLVSNIIAFADGGRVIYTKNAGDFIFEPGSDYSPTDLFHNFKSVMPGDSITQKITVKNSANKNVKVKIYIRSLGAEADSVHFLSNLNLTVQKSKDNKMEFMFDAAANETAGMTDWVYLGTLYSGGEVNLDVILSVPIELDNEFAKQIGYLDWEFMIEEFPVGDDDPKVPQTGDSYKFEPWIAVMCGSILIMFFIVLWRRKRKKEEN